MQIQFWSLHTTHHSYKDRCQTQVMVIIYCNWNRENVTIKYQLQRFQSFWNVNFMSVLFWDFTQHWMAVCYRYFGTAYGPQLQGSNSYFFLDCLTLEDGAHRLSWNVHRNYHSTLSKIPKECRSHSHRDRSPRSCITLCQLVNIYQCFSLDCLHPE